MANYDDIFNASQSVETDEKSYSSFDKEEWACLLYTSPSPRDG